MKAPREGSDPGEMVVCTGGWPVEPTGVGKSGWLACASVYTKYYNHTIKIY